MTNDEETTDADDGEVMGEDEFNAFYGVVEDDDLTSEGETTHGSDDSGD